MDIVTLFGIALALAMDAFAVALGTGMILGHPDRPGTCSGSAFISACSSADAGDRLAGRTDRAAAGSLPGTTGLLLVCWAFGRRAYAQGGVYRPG